MPVLVFRFPFRSYADRLCSVRSIEFLYCPFPFLASQFTFLLLLHDEACPLVVGTLWKSFSPQGLWWSLWNHRTRVVMVSLFSTSRLFFDVACIRFGIPSLVFVLFYPALILGFGFFSKNLCYETYFGKFF